MKTEVAGTATAAKAAGPAVAKAAEVAKSGWQKAQDALSGYAADAMAVGKNVGDVLVGAFRSAEQAFAAFVRTGKLDFRSLVTSMIVDLAKVGAQRFLFGPLSKALSGAIGNLGSVFAGVFHGGGVVGAPAFSRTVPVAAFAGAPRYHTGGAVGLKPDEVPAILQRGERVLSRRETDAYDRRRSGQGSREPVTVNVTIQTRDAESFRQSRTQVAADIARAVSLGRRGL